VLQFTNAIYALSCSSLNDFEDDHKQPKQAFNAGSLKDIEEEEVGSMKNLSVGNLKNKKEAVEHKKQVFRAGELEDIDDTEKTPRNKEAEKTVKNKKQSFKAGSLQDVDDEERSQKEKKAQPHKSGLKIQVFHSGDLENDNDFNEARNRKRSQEDFVIMEEPEEDEGHHGRKDSHDIREARATEEIDEDEIREQHRNAVIKATNLIKNKYMHPIKTEQYERAQKEVQQDLRTQSAKILKTDYDTLKDRSNDDLVGLEKTLKTQTQKDVAPLEKLHLEYQEVTNRVQKPGAQEETGSKSKNKMAQSTDLMNLVVDPERRGKDLKGSIENAASKKKPVFESQNLESQLASYEDLKKSGNGALRNGQNVRDSGTNLMKKSIQGGIAEYL